MKRHPIHPLALVICIAARAFAQAAPTLAVIDANVVDVVKGETLGHQTVLIASGRIAAAGSSDSISIPPQAIRIQGEGRYLIPASGTCISISAATTIRLM